MRFNIEAERVRNKMSEEIIPLLTENEKERLLAFGQGMVFKATGSMEVEVTKQKAG